MKAEDVRKALDAALREVDPTADRHPWSAVDCASHNEGLSCCLDPRHPGYGSLLDYLAERLARELPKVSS